MLPTNTHKLRPIRPENCKVSRTCLDQNTRSRLGASGRQSSKATVVTAKPDTEFCRGAGTSPTKEKRLTRALSIPWPGDSASAGSHRVALGCGLLCPTDFVFAPYLKGCDVRKLLEEGTVFGSEGTQMYEPMYYKHYARIYTRTNKSHYIDKYTHTHINIYIYIHIYIIMYVYIHMYYQKFGHRLLHTCMHMHV